MELGAQKRLQGFVSRAVPVLLAANAVAVVGMLAADELIGTPAEGPAAVDGTAGGDSGRTIALITRRDGSTMRVDTGTSAGKQALDAARQEGLTVVTLKPLTTSTTSTSTTTSTTSTTTPGGSGLNLDPGKTVTTLTDLVEKLTGTTGGLITDTGKQIGDTVTSIGDGTPVAPVTGTTGGVVTGTTGQVGSTVGGTGPVVSGVVNGAAGTVTSPAPAPVQTQTTTAPAPTSPVVAPVTQVVGGALG